VALAHPSALLEAAKKGEAELYALFGGQGVNEVRVLVDWPLTWGGMLTC
jgi:hypothetical protein